MPDPYPALQATYHSPLGPMTMVISPIGLAALWWSDTDGPLQRSPFEPHCPDSASDNPVYRQTVAWLDAYFSRRPCPPAPPLDLRGSDFRLRVWSRLLSIPYGQTTTYGRLAGLVATDMGRPRMSAQAIGQAVGSNPVCLIVPCHRVIGSDGSLTGYAGLLWRKSALLSLEKGETPPPDL